MTNREKLFEVLHKMNNQNLSFTVNFSCGNECPCYEFCKNSDSISCNKILEEWLDSDEE